MAKRNESILDVLVIFPWWVAASLAVFAFIGLRFMVPVPEVSTPFLRGITAGLPAFAPMASAFLGLAALVSAFRAWSRRRLLNDQSSIEDIRQLDWQDFERLVGEAYRRDGYSVHERGLGGPDGGVDLNLRRGSEYILVQCKHWQTWKVGVKPLRELYGVMAAEKATGGIFVASGHYTRDALDFAKDKNLTLVDGADLVRQIDSVRDVRLDTQSSVRKSATLSFVIPLLIVAGSLSYMRWGDRVSVFKPKMPAVASVASAPKVDTRNREAAEAEAERQDQVHKARALFAAQYVAPPECAKWSSDRVMVTCTNHQMRARKSFLDQHPQFSGVRDWDL